MNAPDNNTPEDIRDIESTLDHIASLDAASAPAGLEDRIYLRTAASLLHGAPECASSAPAPAPIPFFRSTAFRLAAMISFVVAVSIYFALPIPGTKTQDQTADLTEDEIIEEIDTVLLAAYQTEPIDELEELDAQLAELFASEELSEFERWLDTEEAL